VNWLADDWDYEPEDDDYEPAFGPEEVCLCSCTKCLCSVQVESVGQRCPMCAEACPPPDFWEGEL